MRMSQSCIGCLLGKNLKKYPQGASEEEILAYQTELRRVLLENREKSAPEVVECLEQIRRARFGEGRDYEDIKRHFNRLMLDYEPRLYEAVAEAVDPLTRAIQYAMAGNFIDFGALETVQEDKLRQFLAAADQAALDRGTVDGLKRELADAKRLVYLTDNCGEIVADKVLIGTIRAQYPRLHITVVVRGRPVLNDATEADAREVGLDRVTDAVIGNGTGIAGTVLTRISEEALRALHAADVLIAKGQGNYESLCGCGLNVYYIFMCKCELFVNRFQVPQYSGLLIRERG